MTKKKVLLTGIDPKLIDSSLANTTGWDASRVQATAQDAIKRLMDLGYEVQTCLVDYGETAESVVSDILSREKFDCIMIGAGTQNNTADIPFCLRKLSIPSIRKPRHLQKYVSILTQVTPLNQSSVGSNQHTRDTLRKMTLQC